MPAFEAAPFPPMPELRRAVPGWPLDDPLTSVYTPDAARTALRAESDTSVLDPVGLRRLWWREVHLLVAMVLLALGAQWVTVLTRQGWLLGGGRLLGLSRLPEEHLRLTDTGRERLERERARLQALAAL